MPTTIQLTTSKMVFGGQALAHHQGRPVFLFNALPGEEVTALITKKKSKYWEGIAQDIITPSPWRQTPEEDHYLSSSPWQILNPAAEKLLKAQLVAESYQFHGDFLPDGWDNITSPVPSSILHSSLAQFGYRNKMEYSFFSPDKKTHSLAFHQRGSYHRFAIQASKLAMPGINPVALQIVKWLNQEEISYRTPKSVIIRANREGKTLTALFLKDKLPTPILQKLTLPDYNQGLQIYYSSHRSPASRPDELLLKSGLETLDEKILGRTIQTSTLSFFQINLPLFEETLLDIDKFLPKKKTIVDLFCGVGSISLPLAHPDQELLLVDNNAQAIELAKINANKAGLKNFEAHCLEAEKITDLLTADQTVILDPPRPGLHPDLTDALLEKLPHKIIYLSCNPVTQARDLKKLLTKYQLQFSRLYNFFPRTPHIEALCVLERKT